MVLSTLLKRLSATAAQTHISVSVHGSHRPRPLGLPWPKCFTPSFPLCAGRKERVRLCVMVSALPWMHSGPIQLIARSAFSEKHQLNNLVEMSDTSRPIYHNELQMPRMDNNGLFIRRQEQRRQEGSIYSLLPMAHSSFSLQELQSLSEHHRAWLAPHCSLPLVPLLCFSGPGHHGYSRKPKKAKLIYFQKTICQVLTKQVL